MNMQQIIYKMTKDSKVSHLPSIPLDMNVGESNSTIHAIMSEEAQIFSNMPSLSSSVNVLESETTYKVISI